MSISIVVLDGYTLNPGDLDWGPLQKLGNCEIYDRSLPEEILPRSQNATVILTNKTILDAQIINSLSKLKYIGVLATGYNVVDIDAARKKNIPVCNVPGYSGMSVAQAVFALLLEITNKVKLHSDAVFQGQWVSAPDFCFTLSSLLELDQLTMGIIGYGDIAKKTIPIAQSLGMKVQVHTRTVPTNPPANIRFVTKEELFQNSDVISLSCPLNKETQGIINAKTIQQMKSTAILINTARGGLIIEQDLADALNQDKILAAGLDVLTTEPPLPTNPLLTAKNCIITPHNAWASLAARQRLLNITVQNITAFIHNNLQNRIN